MLDRIVIVRNEAHFIFTDRRPFILSSDDAIIPFLMWFLDHPQSRLVIKNDVVVDIEFIKFSDEDTVEIKVDVA